MCLRQLLRCHGTGHLAYCTYEIEAFPLRQVQSSPLLQQGIHYFNLERRDILLILALQECQIAAWNGWHKYECKILTKKRAADARGGFAEEGDDITFSMKLRTLLRLLVLHANNRFTKEEWAEIQSLHDNVAADTVTDPLFYHRVYQDALPTLTAVKSPLNSLEYAHLTSAVCSRLGLSSGLC